MSKRNPFEVFDQILKALPTKKLKNELQQIINPYKAPEQYWGLLNYFVNKVVSHPPKEEWEWKIVSILTTKTIEQLKREVKEND